MPPLHSVIKKSTMKSITHRTIHPIKDPLFNSKFISSLAVVETPSIVEPISELQHQHFPQQHDHFNVFKQYAKSTHYALKTIQSLHTHLLKTALLYSNLFVSNSLLDWYCKSGALCDAFKLFDTIPQPNVISWNVMISGCNFNSAFEDSCGLLGRMRVSGFEPNEITYGSIFSACACLQDSIFGEQVYSLAIKNGSFLNGYVRTGMIDLFAKSGRFNDALRVFYDVECENVVSWNTMISGAVRNGENWLALELFREMCFRSLVPNSFTFSSVLTACASLEESDIGKGVHVWAIKHCAKDVFVGTALVDLYAKCGEFGEAMKEFSQMPIRNVVSWTVIISGFVKKDDSISAFKFFKEMLKTREEINSFTITSLLTACAKPSMFHEAIQAHGWILKAGFYLNPVVGAALINMYTKISAINSSELMFAEMENKRNPSTWAAMISSFVQNKNSIKAIELFLRMLQEGLRPDEYCYSAVLSAINCINLGRQLHCYTLKIGLSFDLSVGCSLFTMYSKCDSIEESYKVFEQIPMRDKVSWASMIAGLAEHGHSGQALGLFRDMLNERTSPDKFTLAAVLTACSKLHSLEKGKEVHGYAYRSGINEESLFGGALITVYSRCGNLELARKVFDMLPEKDEVSCSSMVTGYVQNGLLEEAVVMFHELSSHNFALSSFTISSVLVAVGNLNRPAIGTQLHSLITKMGLDSDVSVGSSLLTMYSKFGSIEECHKAFDQIDKPDMIGWTAMIESYAQHGKGGEALEAYEQMRKKGIKPDAVTFVGVLSACSHSGLVEEGYFYFSSMKNDFGIEPSSRHYACMVDLLGRSGRLKEAEKFINSMSTDADTFIWATLLAACKQHGDIELAKVAARKVMELKPRDAGTYVLLSNMCADLGQWEDVMEIRSLMKRTGVSKEPGWSFM